MNNFDVSEFCVAKGYARTNEVGPKVLTSFMWQYATWVYRDLEGVWYLGDGSGPVTKVGSFCEAANLAASLWAAKLEA